jgi:hypothetical protein
VQDDKAAILRPMFNHVAMWPYGLTVFKYKDLGFVGHGGVSRDDPDGSIAQVRGDRLTNRNSRKCRSKTASSR